MVDHLGIQYKLDSKLKRYMFQKFKQLKPLTEGELMSHKDSNTKSEFILQH